MTQKSDITTTKFLNKPNNLTTPYFNPDEMDISGKEDKTDHDADIHRLEIDISGKEDISSHNNDITNINTALNTKESKTDHNTDISNLQNQINNLFQGDQKPQMKNTNRIGVILNYNLGGILFWSDGGYGASLNNIDGDLAMKICIF